ncbi:MAG: hypothetical protein Q8Q29_09195 [Actinomycetota bacterium]|nr:hypothetical protein [Actinomycetota bacterium]
MLVMLLVGTAANLASMWFVPLGSRPVWEHAAGDLAHLIHRDDDYTEDQYGFYVDLGDVARGGTLVVPLDSWVDPYTARGLAGVTVEFHDFSPDGEALLAGLGTRTGRVLTGETPQSYWIVSGPSTQVFWLASVGGGYAVVPTSVAAVPVG